MSTVISRDGTRIAYDRRGSGPPIILIGGGLDDGSENAPLARALAQSFTVFNYARRGRGASGDTPPYTVDRELEDLAAVLEPAGPSAHLVGISSGGALALQAAATGATSGRIVVYEVPYAVTEPDTRRWRDYVDRLQTALRADTPGAAIEAFMQVAGASAHDIESARASPHWEGLELLAPTLAYDAALLGDGRPPDAILARVSNAVLVLTGGTPDAVGLGAEFFGRAADALQSSLVAGHRQVLEGEGHVPNAQALADVITTWVGREADQTGVAWW